jgi:DNA-binding NarL/FixJ family response regulator
LRRVLIGAFGGVLRIGLGEMLREGGCELVAEDPADDRLVERLIVALPDIVMLDLGAERGDELARAISAAFPSVKVIAFAVDRQMMRVYPPFHRGEYYTATLDADRLAETIERV